MASFSSRIMHKTDVFPISKSTRVPRLPSPDRKFFKEVPGKYTVYPFTTYLNDNNLVYYDKKALESNPRYIPHISDLGKDTRRYVQSKNKGKTWDDVAKKLKKPLEQGDSINQRTSFKFNHFFLTKSFFTFGQRTVAPGTKHIYQTAQVPISFYFVNFKAQLKPTLINKIFKADEQPLYEWRIMKPDSCYFVKSGTTYVILTRDKCFFSLHVVDEGHPLEFECLDILKTKKKSSPPPLAIYDKPIKTPYIEYDDPAERMPPPPAPPPRKKMATFQNSVVSAEPTHPPSGIPAEPTEAPSNVLTPAEPTTTPSDVLTPAEPTTTPSDILTPAEPTTAPAEEGSFFTPPTYMLVGQTLIPAQNVVKTKYVTVPSTEKIVQIVNPETVSWYQNLKNKVTTNPMADLPWVDKNAPKEEALDLSWKPELDLSALFSVYMEQDLNETDKDLLEMRKFF